MTKPELAKPTDEEIFIKILDSENPNTGEVLAFSLLEKGFEIPPYYKNFHHKKHNGKTLAHAAAEKQNLPPHFSGWDWIYTDESGVKHSVAGIAAEHRKLNNFNGWGRIDIDGKYIIEKFISAGGYVPYDDIDEDLWKIKNHKGYTLAHLYACNNKLPVHFPFWDLEGEDGLLVAEVAASNAQLPLYFDKWLLRNKHSGKTIAHVAVTNYENFHDHIKSKINFPWDQRDYKGRTVAHIAAKYNTFDAPLEALQYRDNREVTVFQVLLDNDRLAKYTQRLYGI